MVNPSRRDSYEGHTNQAKYKAIKGAGREVTYASPLEEFLAVCGAVRGSVIGVLRLGWAKLTTPRIDG